MHHCGVAAAERPVEVWIGQASVTTKRVIPRIALAARGLVRTPLRAMGADSTLLLAHKKHDAGE